MGDKLYELVKEGALVQSIIGIAATGAVIYLAIAQVPESQALLVITGAAMGHFFTAGAARAAEQRATRMLERERQLGR